jgi:hypothetical protein
MRPQDAAQTVPAPANSVPRVVPTPPRPPSPPPLRPDASVNLGNSDGDPSNVASMKRQLRKGTAEDLNLYSVEFGGALGGRERGPFLRCQRRCSMAQLPPAQQRPAPARTRPHPPPRLVPPAPRRHPRLRHVPRRCGARRGPGPAAAIAVRAAAAAAAGTN